MKSEWKTSTIADICSMVTDGSHFSPKNSDDGEYMVSVKDFKEYGFDFLNCKRISKTDYDKLKKSGCVPEIGDVLIGKDGARFFEDIIIYNQPEKPALLSSIAILRSNPDMVIPYYLYYLCKNPIFKKNVKDNYGSGSAIPRIVLKDFKRMPITYPNIELQKKIVSILYTIDDKIELNNKINENLEQQAQAIFKSWFVDFEPFGGVMPKKWQETTLGTVTKNIRTKISDKNTSVFSAINSGHLVYSDEYFTKQVYSKDISKYIVVNKWDFAYNPARINIGSIGINDLDVVGCVSPVYVVFSVQQEYHSFFRFYFRQNLFKQQSLTRASGSVRQTLSYEDFSLIDVVYPTNDYAKKFDEIWKSYYSVIVRLREENERLAALRDTLLPKLMSGEIDVSAVKI